jgi:hypothetical protein|eukprot:COSAG06_NODE_3075_length_5891_cov_2.111188_4_plen_149_part_00
MRTWQCKDMMCCAPEVAAAGDTAVARLGARTVAGRIVWSLHLVLCAKQAAFRFRSHWSLDQSYITCASLTYVIEVRAAGRVEAGVAFWHRVVCNFRVELQEPLRLTLKLFPHVGVLQHSRYDIAQQPPVHRAAGTCSRQRSSSPTVAH